MIGLALKEKRLASSERQILKFVGRKNVERVKAEGGQS
jgi:hypothetical protein